MVVVDGREAFPVSESKGTRVHVELNGAGPRTFPHVWTYRRLILVATASIWLSVLPLRAFGSDRSDLKSTLQAKYAQKILMLRGFYMDDRLHFDSHGAVRGKAHPGTWTLSRIGIDKVRVSADKVELEGPRIAEMNDPKQSKFVPVRTTQNVHIVVERDASKPDTTVMNALQQIFLDENERLIDLVPEYWKAYVSGALETVPQQGFPDCYRIKGRVVRTEDGGISIPCEEHATAKAAGQQKTSFDFDTSSLPYLVGKNVTAPKVTFAPDPNYVELARLSKYEGTTVLELTVTADGSTSDIDVTRPIGFGLDDQGVATVKTWRFKPATLKGQPVPVRIKVEVSFRLY
jgi:TonB family protein